jgi:glycerol-1-phosphate dehydrogenase [NAD(P)+]
MELPRRILVGSDILHELGEFVVSLGFESPILVVSGPTVGKMLKPSVTEALSAQGFKAVWCTVHQPSVDEANRVRMLGANANGIIAVGGGKVIDVAKFAAQSLNRPYISVPTSASRDGIASPFASLKGLDRPYSIKTKPPAGIFADIAVIARAPSRLLSSGCADLIAKETAVRDWELAKKEVGEYFGHYAANLALMSARLVLENAQRISAHDEEGVRDVVEALISAGVAAGIAGSSRPCSGSEHLISHALDMIRPGVGLHGEKCGLASIMMAKLHGLDWVKIRDALKALGAPTSARDLNLDPEALIRAIVMAPQIRPDRYTILHKFKMTEEQAAELARSVEVL